MPLKQETVAIFLLPNKENEMNDKESDYKVTLNPDLDHFKAITEEIAAIIAEKGE